MTTAAIILHFASGAVLTGAIAYQTGPLVPPGFACAVIEKGHRLIPATLSLGRADRVVRLECHS